MDCSFCKNKFVSKTSLNHHQKTAKYCLKLQGNKTIKYLCKSCNKNLSTQHRLLTHYSSCDKYKHEQNNKHSILEKNQLFETIELLKEQLIQKDLHIGKLEDKLENIAIKAVQRPTTTNNTNNKTQINNIIQKMEPVTQKHLIDNAPNLTLEHVQKGASGYAEYALEYPLKDRVICVDYARRKIKFKDQEGNVITDPEMAKLAPMFFENIKNKSSELVYGLNNTNNAEMDSTMFEQVAKLFNTNADVKNGSTGIKSDFFHDFVKHVCSGSIVE
jgi:hypothetical protein